MVLRRAPQDRLMFRPIAALALALAGFAAGAQPLDRGAMLYQTHCIECHTAQMHWRERRLARDWPTLRMQVRRWQAVARLDWSDADIDAVTRHLNDTVYRFPRWQAKAVTEDYTGLLPR
jgi:mono/diheme cytochrome c family protein